MVNGPKWLMLTIKKLAILLSVPWSDMGWWAWSSGWLWPLYRRVGFELMWYCGLCIVRLALLELGPKLLLMTNLLSFLSLCLYHIYSVSKIWKFKQIQCYLHSNIHAYATRPLMGFCIPLPDSLGRFCNPFFISFTIPQVSCTSIPSEGVKFCNTSHLTL